MFSKSDRTFIEILRCKTSNFTCFADIDFSWLAVSVKYFIRVLSPVASISSEVSH